MLKWTIRRRIVASFGVVLALIVAVGSLALADLGRIGAESESLLNDSLARLTITGELNTLWGARPRAHAEVRPTHRIPALTRVCRPKSDPCARSSKTPPRATRRRFSDRMTGTPLRKYKTAAAAWLAVQNADDGHARWASRRAVGFATRATLCSRVRGPAMHQRSKSAPSRTNRRTRSSPTWRQRGSASS